MSAKPINQRSEIELLSVASRIKRLGEDTFEIPSASDPEKKYIVNIALKTCRDQNGNGCPALYYRGDCYHMQASFLILDLLKGWSNPNGSNS